LYALAPPYSFVNVCVMLDLDAAVCAALVQGSATPSGRAFQCEGGMALERSQRRFDEHQEVGDGVERQPFESGRKRP
jgi:hypothetical protein